MRIVARTILAAAACAPAAAHAADALKFGSPPAWVHPLPIPDAKPTDASIAVLLEDTQVAFEKGKTTTYSDGAIKIQNPQGLAAGNLSIIWQPATDTVTVNKLLIYRDGKVIDVLADGQTFTVLRRETNLEAATLDGTLTATIQPEGLQQGDILEMATTIEHSDPVFNGHVEAMFATWGGIPIKLAHARLSWPSDLHLNVRQTSNLPAAVRSSANGMNTFELSGTDVQPLVLPKGAPARFLIGRLAEASDFSSWSDLADLFRPLFRDASAIPATGPLHDEVEKIRASTSDSKLRTQDALQLVQDRVRYVALVMGQGSYVPASAEQTWSRRFGDCKGKTALLLGILNSLGIAAEPVVVQTKLGDMIADRLPMVQLFDHVLVRAHIGSRDYWLDGTRTGDASLDAIKTPDFVWGLPLIEKASLTKIVPPPLAAPAFDTQAVIDASKGIHAPASAKLTQIVRGDAATAINAGLAQLTAEQQTQFFEAYWKKSFDLITPGATTFSFNKTAAELKLSMAGTAKLDWDGGYFHVPNSSIGYNPDFERLKGALSDAPVAVDYPEYVHSVTSVRVPQGFFPAKMSPPSAVRETLAGVEFRRITTASADTMTVETSTRSVVPEVPYALALAASARLKALADEDVSLSIPASYRPTEADVATLTKDQPASASGLVDTANSLMDAGKFDDAIKALDKALQLEPKSAIALADRGVSHAWQRDYSTAKTDLDAAEAIDPNNAVVARGRALVAELQGDCASAITNYTKSLQKDQNSAFAQGHRAICERDLGRDADALSDSELALRGEPRWLDLRVMRSNILLVQGKPDAAAKEADALARDMPQEDYAWTAAGSIYALAGMQSKAMAAFDRALSIKPQAYIYLGRARSRPASDRAGRTSDLEAALKLKPDDVDTMADVAEQYADMGDFKHALAVYDRLVVSTPGFSQYAVLRAAVLSRSGKTAEAAKILAAERSKAKTGDDYNQLCWIKATNGMDLNSALGDCKTALKLSPDKGAYLDSLGMALLKLGRLDDALAAYNQAITKRTGAASLMGRALVYERKGDRAHAVQDAAAARRQSAIIDQVFAGYGLTLQPQP